VLEDLAYEVLIEVIAGVRDGVLALAGDGSVRAQLEAHAAHLGLGGRVRFLRWMDDVAGFFQALGVFAMSSHSEGTSISLLDAMSCRLPPVVLRVGGNTDLPGPHRAGQLTSPRDVCPRGTAGSPCGRSQHAKGDKRDPRVRGSDLQSPQRRRGLR
jgi:glycosyltransferase involved in cell wall biosynthesis